MSLFFTVDLKTNPFCKITVEKRQFYKGIISPNNESQHKEWLRSSEVRTMLKISAGTLQNLRISGTLPFRKIGGSMYYDKSVIEKILEGE